MTCIKLSVAIARVKFFTNLLNDMSALYSYQSVIYYLEIFAQYLLAKYCSVIDTDHVRVGSVDVGLVSKSDAFKFIVQLRNAIVHGDINRLEVLLRDVDEDFFLNDYSPLGDPIATRGLCLLASVDWRDFKEYILPKEGVNYE